METMKSLRFFAQAAKVCCEIANKALNNITNRVIHFIKEGNISKLLHKNKHRSSLLNGCIDEHVTTDLEHHFVFPIEIVLTTQHADTVIWSVKLKKNFVIVLMVPFKENFDWANCKLEKYEDLWEQYVRNGWMTHVFPIEVGCRGFIINSISVFLTKFGLSQSDKWKYIKMI